MTTQFKNMQELVEYLGVLEQRLDSLEQENRQLRATPPKQSNMDGNMITQYVVRMLPQTNLLHRNFLQRAFAVWGHFFVANLLISISVGVIYFCLMMVLFGSVFGSQIHNIPK